MYEHSNDLLSSKLFTILVNNLVGQYAIHDPKLFTILLGLVFLIRLRNLTLR